MKAKENFMNSGDFICNLCNPVVGEDYCERHKSIVMRDNTCPEFDLCDDLKTPYRLTTEKNGFATWKG